MWELEIYRFNGFFNQRLRREVYRTEFEANTAASMAKRTGLIVYGPRFDKNIPEQQASHKVTY